MKLLQNPSLGEAEENIERFFLFLALAAILFTEEELWSNFGGGSPKEHSCEIITKSVKPFWRRTLLKVFLVLALMAPLFNEAELFKKFW